MNRGHRPGSLLKPDIEVKVPPAAAAGKRETEPARNCDVLTEARAARRAATHLPPMTIETPVAEPLGHDIAAVRVADPASTKLARCLALLAILGPRSTAVRAAVRYVKRRDRDEHPAGNTDRGGRWYPNDSENLDTRYYRSPSREYPWSYMLACRTLAHCAQLEGCKDLLLARRIARVIDTTRTPEEAVQATRLVTSKSRKDARKKSS